MPGSRRIDEVQLEGKANSNLGRGPRCYLGEEWGLVSRFQG